ncbi:MAG: AraC family transcriptional regulator [Moraxellaceae bacterium]|nr:AraC family transcriptional regulator [Moraxellaceae bacterium]MBP8853063.1 AraC family transcriptional regulator [Moraxellaceae bacterium]MBP9045572.1 AraC family transcriptional regulator [Moraxellaceae bacterium]MBP9730775.1 AraC family transcriptional regulator [Moraxellaceae bacterium]HQV40864.1 AraC family transcriptional regulator [Moraxellaceae bacterium]
MSRNIITMAYVQRLLSGAAREGADLSELMREAGLDSSLLAHQDARLGAGDFIRLMQVVMRRTEDEFIGLGRGTKSKPGTFSMMAHAVINCANLGKAIQRSVQFYKLVDMPLETRLERGETESRLVLDFPALESRENVLEAMVFTSVRFWSWLTGKNLELQSILFDFSEPPQADEFRRLFKGRVVYNASYNALVFPTAWLSLPLVQNPLSLSKFLKDSLALIIVGNAQPIGLPEQIRAIISKEYGNSFPDFAQVCEQLNMTPQTLRRRLKEENTSYQEIKDSIRKDASFYYLGKEELSIDEIALMMGFSEASSFHRAFKKWTGRTPAGYRRELLGLPEDVLDDENDDDEEGWVAG